MNKTQFFQNINKYYPITAVSQAAWEQLLRKRTYHKGELLVSVGQVPRNFAFICKGLAYQSYLPPEGEMIIKYFFAENRLAASVTAAMTSTPSKFAITAIEETTVLEYNFDMFSALVNTHPDIALFYLSYLEKHWVIEKEPLEIAFRSDTAAVRYKQFLLSHNDILPRLKKYHIASYLGITPTQLSRIIKGK